MSDDFENVTTEQPDPTISPRRILWTMGVVAVLGGLAGFVFISQPFGWGILLGGILSFINYFWLKISLKKLFDNALAHGKSPKFLAVRYLARYVLLGAVLTLIFLTHTIPVVAVILGLLSFAVAVVIEGLIRIFLTFFKNGKL